MNVPLRFVAVAVLVANAACSNNNSPPDASTEAGQDSSGNDSGSNDAGAPDVQNDVVEPTVNPVCTLPATAGAGSCITLTGDGGIACNPITNAPCNVDAGEACDFHNSGFECYPPPPTNTAALCATCDDLNGPACLAGSTCVPTMTGNECALFCCVDGDCGDAGHCDLTTLKTTPVGICTQ